MSSRTRYDQCHDHFVSLLASFTSAPIYDQYSQLMPAMQKFVFAKVVEALQAPNLEADIRNENLEAFSRLFNKSGVFASELPNLKDLWAEETPVSRTNIKTQTLILIKLLK
jgi:hypothetical protein